MAVSACALIGQFSRLLLAETGFAGESGYLPWIVAAAAVAAAAWWVSSQWRRDRKPDLYQPRKLFDELCKLHKLPRRDVMLLHMLAKERGLELPAQLFVHPEYFTPDAEHEDDGFAEALTELRKRLFGDEASAAA